MRHPRKKLEKLERFLFAQLRVADAMSLSEFDGFCAGLLVCPEMIMPSEWLPVVLGQNGPLDFEDMTDAEQSMDLIMDHYNRVAQFLTPPCHELETIYETDPNSDEILWEPWVEGFCRAMDLRSGAWHKIVLSGDNELVEGLAMLRLLRAFNHGEVDLSDEVIEQIDRESPDRIPNIVLRLNDWVKSQQQWGVPFALQQPANSNIKPFPNGKVGRNLPCPCGSGIKYKKCCG